MRTRSSAKRKDDDPAVGDAGDRIKRCKTQFCAEQSMASRAKSPLKEKCHNPERAAEGLSASSTSKNGDDEMTFVGALRKRGAADRSSQIATSEKSRASLKKAITKKHGTKVSPVLIQPGQSCDNTHTLDDHLHTLVASTDCGEDGLQIVDTPLSPQELDGVQCQLHEDDHHNVADATLVKGKTEKCLRHKKRGASLGGYLEESIQGKQNGSHTTSRKRRFCPRSGKSKCRPGNMKQFKNQRKESIRTTPTEVSQQLKSCYSRKRLNAAKSRWKNLAQSILSTKIPPEIPASASEDLTRSIANSKNYKTLSLPKKQRKPLAAANASAADQRPVTGRIRQKVRKQQLSLLKRMKTWLTEAKFSQGAKEENSNDAGEEFIMTEDERYAFAQTMVQSCQKNPTMRTIFLESVRRLTLSGLMQAAASNLLQQGPCEEAQNVMNSWADFKEKSMITKTLPMNLLSAVNQLHEKRGELSTNISMPNLAGVCTLSQIGAKTWKFQLPGSSLEDPLLTRSLGQDSPV